ncbi:MAG TPA: hypothetical protein VLE99_04575 [Candidatus Saccharimonadales bacterium]|nr:hypothetical protein [Candidatus Saccharimonadales bacterium]
MAKTKKPAAASFDGVYVLKLVLYVILGSLWVKVGHNSSNFSVPLPIGFAVGLLFTAHEHFRIDRKVEYGVLVVAALLGLIAPYGLFVSV